MSTTFHNALDTILDGNAIAFLGAGFSLGAKDHTNNDLLSASGLAMRLCRELSLPETTPLDQISDIYLTRNAPKQLLELLKGLYTCRTPTATQKTIASAPWRRIYTTNYDNVFERAAADLGIVINPLTLSSDATDLATTNRYCVHINGSIVDATEDMLQSELKLTTTSYLTEAFKDSQWSQFFKFDIELADAIFFIGYSLYDLDIKRILFASDNLRDKCYIITSPSDGVVQSTLLSQFGEVAPIGATAFAAMLAARKLAYAPRSPLRPAFASFRQFSLPAVPVATTDGHALDLFTFGRVSTDAIIASQSNSPQTFHLHRLAAIRAAREAV